MSAAATEPHFRPLLHPQYWLSWLGVGLLWPLAYLPSSMRHWLGKQGGNWLYRHHSKRRHIVDTNLQLCFPELALTKRQSLAKQHLQHYASAMLDYSILFFRSRIWLHQRCQLISSPSFEQAITAQEPIILLLAHSVWLEFGPLTLSQYHHCYGSYKPFSNAVFDYLIARSRLKDVDCAIPRDDGMLKLVRLLTPERILIFLPDEDHGEAFSVYAPFMGQTKATLNTPPRLAKLGKARCFVAMSIFNPALQQYQLITSEAFTDYPSKEPQKDAAQLNTKLEQLIRQYPTQYMWLLKLFKTQPNQQKLY